MSETKFTKGPWIAFYPHKILSVGHISVESERGEHVYTSEVFKSNLDEQSANARLIEKAPDMYEMLDEVSHVLSHHRNPTHDAYIKAIDKLLAEIRGDK